MKKKDIQELKMKAEAELTRLVETAGVELRSLRFDLAAGKVKDISKIRDIKKRVARIHTFLKERMLENKQK